MFTKIEKIEKWFLENNFLSIPHSDAIARKPRNVKVLR